MAVVSQNISGDASELIDAPSIQVGLGIQRANYSSETYAQKKQDTLIIGFLSKIMYIGFEYDKEPLLLSMAHEPSYNTVIGINLRYLPLQSRKNITRFVLESNQARLQSNQNPIVKYNDIVKIDSNAKGAVRRYKLPGTRVLGNIPLSDWEAAISQKSGFEDHYRKFI